MFATVVGKKVRDRDTLSRRRLGLNVHTRITGHWIQDCPTNSDRDYDNRPRIKRTTGIPRSFLKAVDQPSEGKFAQGIMVTPEGGYVVAQPDL